MLFLYQIVKRLDIDATLCFLRKRNIEPIGRGYRLQDCFDMETTHAKTSAD